MKANISIIYMRYDFFFVLKNENDFYKQEVSVKPICASYEISL